MATKRATVGTPSDYAEFGTDLGALLKKYNGRLWKIKEADLISAVVPIVAQSVLSFVALWQLRQR